MSGGGIPGGCMSEVSPDTRLGALKSSDFTTWMERRAGGLASHRSDPEGLLMKRRAEVHVHEHVSTFEDLLLTGGSVWRADCSCGYVTRPATEPGVARGLLRRHMVLAGRGRPRRDR